MMSKFKALTEADLDKVFKKFVAGKHRVTCDENHAHAAHGVTPNQRVRAEFPLHPRVLAAFRALDVGEGSHRRNVHRSPARMAVGYGFGAV